MPIVNGKRTAILMMGPPYAGKGTQSERLAETPNFVHLSKTTDKIDHWHFWIYSRCGWFLSTVRIPPLSLLTEWWNSDVSTGDMFRSLTRETDIGRRVLDLTENGNYVTDELTYQLFDEFLPGYLKSVGYDPEKQHIVLDGIPRRVAQIPFVNERFHILQIIRLDVPYSLLEERRNERARKEGRKDDMIEGGLDHRLKVYSESTVPIFGHYDTSLITLIDGSGSKDEVYALIQGNLK